MCSILPAILHLSGSDYTSKICTKLAAINADPEKYLLHFAQGRKLWLPYLIKHVLLFLELTGYIEFPEITSVNAEKQMELAEEYLVKTWKKNCEAKTFDELRVWVYRYGSKGSLKDLPPTSASIRLHILRALHATLTYVTCLEENAPTLDPLCYGYVECDGGLVPKRVETLLPPTEELLPNCRCKNCSRRTCKCREAGVDCCSFCYCRKDNNECKNQK